MANILYHLHIDAARMPDSLLSWATGEAGFHCDDFPHSFNIDGIDVNARHLTKYIYDPNPVEIKNLCQSIQEKANATDLLGFIQAEFIMDEQEWTGNAKTLAPVHTPFKLGMRALDPGKGESFKKHEIHLELERAHSSLAIVNALMGCGFHILETENYVTFTCSGHPKELILIRKMIADFLQPYETDIRGKLVHEATAFWSMHGMDTVHLQTIVESVH